MSVKLEEGLGFGSECFQGVRGMPGESSEQDEGKEGLVGSNVASERHPLLHGERTGYASLST